MMKPHLAACAVIGLNTIAAAGPLDLSGYPKGDEISYGRVVAEVRPRQFVKLKAPLSGRLFLKAKDGMHEKGTVWAEFEPEQIALEREAMSLTRSLHESKDKPMMRLELSDSRAALVSRRDELKRNLQMLREIQQEPELAELYTGGQDGDGEDQQSRIQQMQSRLIEQIATIDEVLSFVGTEKQVREELRLAELQLDRKDRELARREEESKLTMPFTGQLRYLVELPDDLAQPLAMQTGQEVAEIADYSTLQCEMLVKRPELRSLPAGALSLEFSRRGAGVLRAHFSTQQTLERHGRSELAYLFEFPRAQATAARPLVGGSVSGELMLKLAAEAMLVPKLDLIASDPDTFKQHGWWRGVELALPGHRAISVGQSHVAIVRKPNGN